MTDRTEPAHSHASGSDKCVDVGVSDCLRPIGDGQSGLVGYIWGHDRAGWSWRCEGFVTMRANTTPRWRQTGGLAEGTLTLEGDGNSSSLICPDCRRHGFVRNGGWVPA